MWKAFFCVVNLQSMILSVISTLLIYRTPCLFLHESDKREGKGGKKHRWAIRKETSKGSLKISPLKGKSDNKYGYWLNWKPSVAETCLCFVSISCKITNTTTVDKIPRNRADISAVCKGIVMSFQINVVRNGQQISERSLLWYNKHQCICVVTVFGTVVDVVSG